MSGSSVLTSVCLLLAIATSVAAQESARVNSLPSDIPETFTPTSDGFDHERREVLIPMRDGVKLHTVILVPKGAKGAPMLMTRTPYDANRLTQHAESAHLESVLNGYDNAADVVAEGGYIRVVQDVRGKHRSEGEYVLNRPIRGKANPTDVDHATDTYDTVDWLVKNVPESNGKVGIIGISYDGFLPLMALVNPHPALKVSVPMNPMVDGWMGDDWFHYGAFRQYMIWWIYRQIASRKGDFKFWSTHHDMYDMFLSAGSAGEIGSRRGMEQLGFWRKLTEHPAYDSFWQDQALDRELATRPLTVPTMIVHGYWDQEDIYGALAAYEALKPKDTQGDKVFLVMGPWYHGQQIREGSHLGAIRFNSDTALHFRKEILAPFLAEHLKDGAPKSGIAPVVAYETGTNRWRNLPAWPAAEGSGRVETKPLYVRAGQRVSFEAPQKSDAAYEEYISDPTKPVPFRRRPIQPLGSAGGLTWPEWLVDDQREASGRTDVVTFVSEVLTEPVHISGQAVAKLVASTSGTDSDWVVKLIDVYPDEVPSQPEMGGYQLMIAGDIFRGRYRESFEKPEAIAADQPLKYTFKLPTANHVFLPGHRMMVQVQSSWFPLYDRNPQTFVPNIFWAKAEDYRKAVQRVYHTAEQATMVELPVVVGGK
jgi:putative CocE/NonD family hydrolase